MLLFLLFMNIIRHDEPTTAHQWANIPLATEKNLAQCIFMENLMTLSIYP